MDLHLQGKKAAITGASSGVGRAAAQALAAEGVQLALCGRRTDALEHTASLVRSKGAHAFIYPADIGEAGAAAGFIQAAEEALGGLDILINSAGIWLTGKCWDVTREDWQRTLDINLTGAFEASQAFTRSLLKKQQPGVILNVNSQAAFNGSTSGHVHYAASKAGMTAMTVSMARELAPHGIRVNGIALGMVDTEMVHQALEADREGYNRRMPLGRPAEAYEMADIITFMVSPRCAYMTGATVDASGGMLMR